MYYYLCYTRATFLIFANTYNSDIVTEGILASLHNSVGALYTLQYAISYQPLLGHSTSYQCHPEHRFLEKSLVSVALLDRLQLRQMRKGSLYTLLDFSQSRMSKRQTA